MVAIGLILCKKKQNPGNPSNRSNLNIMPAPVIDDAKGDSIDGWVRTRFRRGKCAELTAGDDPDKRENGDALVGVGFVLATTLAQVCDMVCAQDMDSLAAVYNMTADEADCLECYGALAARCLRLAKQIPLVSELVANTNCGAGTDDSDNSDWQLTGVFIILTLWFVVYAHSKLSGAKAPTASAGASDPARVPRKTMSVDFDEAHDNGDFPRGSEVFGGRESITEL